MTPIQMSSNWLRRLYAALFVGALGYVTPYILNVTGLVSIPNEMGIDLIAAVGGGLVALASLTFFILANKVTSTIPALAAYLVFALTTAYLVQSSGGASSPFLAVWAVVILVAPAFGAYGWLPAIVIVAVYIATEYLSSDLNTTSVITITLSSIIPLAAGSILRSGASNKEDSTHRHVKNLASQLSEVANKSEIVINAIGDGVIAVDSKGVVQLINPAAQEILGWGKQDALMLNYRSILKLTREDGEELSPGEDPIQEVLNNNQQSRNSKLTATTNSGKKINISLLASPIGEVGSGSIAVFRDVTNERAEEREQAEFISTASHEMRTPVASIEGYLGLAINPNTATVDDRARDFITKAQEAAQHLGRLFQDLLDVSRSEDGRLQNEPKVIDLVTFIEGLTQGLAPKAAEKGLTINFIPGNSRAQKKIMPVYFVNLDNDHIREVINNLVENAIKYTPKGEVSVDVSGTDDKVIISIKDTGLGIPTEDIPHLFQKFYRVNNMDRQSIGGTGLGLFLCRRLVEGMQGRLWVESVFGSGSTFFVELPRIDSQLAETLLQEQEQRMTTQAAHVAENSWGEQLPPEPQPAAPVTQIPVTVVDSNQPIQPQPVAQPITQPIAVSQPANPIPVGSFHQPVQQPAPPHAPPPPAAAPTVAPATNVPRGESLTREQINQRVQQLEALARQQQQERLAPPR